MSSVSIEIGTVDQIKGSDAIYGGCVVQETLTIGSTLTNAITAAQVTAGARIARIAPIDAGCYFAVGSTPNASATAKTTATSARRFVAQGDSFPVSVSVGDKIATATGP